ncbi:MAG: peptide chain release factor 1 [Phycisphaerae bacterium]|jgi:peptide chain release factor 1|nr:peptide chain release factor 1 [Phycisphaerae bacterium]
MSEAKAFEELEAMSRQMDEIDAQTAEPEIASNPARMTGLMRTRGRLARLVNPYRQFRDVQNARREAEAIAQDAEQDAEFRELADEEADAHREEEHRLLEQLQGLLLSHQQGMDSNRVILEIRAGTGGEEAALFARDLADMYSHYAEGRRWKVELMSASPTDLGGFREIIMAIEGEGAYQRLFFESGGHRVQRVPKTEAQGRIHTSAATVAAMTEPEEIDIQIKPDEIEITAMRSSGPGGQKVNKTSSAVRIVHLPTGITVHIQDEKSQHKNRAKALRILRSRVFDLYESRRRAKRDADRKTKVGSGDRSQRIRTYNFPQNRITDHRIHFTAYNLDRVMIGEMDALLDALAEDDRRQRLEQLSIPSS